MAVDMGLQVNYNSEVQKLLEMEDGSFIMTTRDGRVRAFSLVISCMWTPGLELDCWGVTMQKGQNMFTSDISALLPRTQS